MSTLRVDSIRGQTADGTNRYVVQTVVHEFNDTTTNSTDSNADLSGSSFSFTPKLATSLLLISISVFTSI